MKRSQLKAFFKSHGVALRLIVLSLLVAILAWLSLRPKAYGSHMSAPSPDRALPEEDTKSCPTMAESDGEDTTDNARTRLLPSTRDKLPQL